MIVSPSFSRPGKGNSKASVVFRIGYVSSVVTDRKRAQALPIWRMLIKCSVDVAINYIDVYVPDKVLYSCQDTKCNE